MQQEQNLQCPRCESTNTKFCYYNNYNLSQPRHFCKDCRRYWTRGGSLRNVPVGGGTRKSSKRSSSSTSASAGTNSKRPSPSSSTGEVKNPDFLFSPFPPIDNDHRMLDMTGSFSSLLSSTAQFGNLFECYQSLDSLPVLRGVARPRMEMEVQSSGESSGNDGAVAQQPPPAVMPENFVNLTAEASGWAGGWPDLSIYTPGGSFQ